MAPYISHLAVAEHVYAQLWTQHEHLGAFLYGSVVPDVSAEPNTLTRWDTHFVGAYSESGQAVLSQGTATFLAQYPMFTTRLPQAWHASERAFLEGYLCHLAADESWRALLLPAWLPNRERLTGALVHTIMTEFNQRAVQRLQNTQRVAQALRACPKIDILNLLDPDLGDDFRRRVSDAVASGGDSESFLTLARGAGESEAWVQERRLQYLEHRDMAQRWLEKLAIDSFYSLAVERSLDMIGRWRQSLQSGHG